MNLHILRMAMPSLFRCVAAILFCCLCSCAPGEHAPAEKVTIAVATLPEATLVQIAQSCGFFRQEGLDVSVRLHPYGKVALRDVLQGKADLATVAETPTMFAIMDGEKISVIATIATSTSNHAIVARRDRGITSIRNLQGKKVATTLGTSSDFFLDAMLLANGVARESVQVVDLPAVEMPGALSRGEVDAVSTFAQYSLLAEKNLRSGALVLRDKDIYRFMFNVVATQQFIRKHPARIRKTLAALVRAEEFVKAKPAEAQKTAAAFSGLDMAILKEIWRGTDLSVTLYQTLILALEDESEWAMKKGASKAKVVPNYLRHVYLDGLQSVKPEEVRILK